MAIVFPSGTLSAPTKVLQVVQTTKTDVFSTTSGSWTSVTGMSVSITPSSTSSKILVLCNASIGQGHYAYHRVVRGSTALLVGASGTYVCTYGGYSGGASEGEHYYGSWTHPIAYLDSPSTTASTTYTYQMRTNGSGHAVLVNRGNANDGNSAFGASSITLLEIGS